MSKDKQSKFWEQEFESKTSSEILPVDNSTDELLSQDVTHMQSELISKYDPHMYFQYNNGKMKGRSVTVSDENYTQIIDDCIVCVFDVLRQDIDKGTYNVEQKQLLLQKVSAAQSIFNSGIQVLISLNLKLDINSAISILHGYTTQCIEPLLKDYEDRKDTRH